MVFSLFLQSIKSRGYTGRITSIKKPNKLDPLEFHGYHWKDFAKRADPQWMNMNLKQKRAHMRDFVMRKFSWDEKLLTMWPGAGIKRKVRPDARWEGFHMTDEELESVLSDIFQTYEETVQR
jgi:hypothetical protein